MVAEYYLFGLLVFSVEKRRATVSRRFSALTPPGGWAMLLI